MEISRNYYTLLVMLATLGIMFLTWAIAAELGYVAPMMFGFQQ